MAGKLDMKDLTLGEVATIEDLSGVSLSALEGQPQGKFLAALVMVVKRRSGEPTFTFNQALNVPMSEAHAILGMSDDETDEAGDDEGKDSSAPKSAQPKKRSSSSR